MVGSVASRPILGNVPAKPAKSASASRLWNVRTASCARPTRFYAWSVRTLPRQSSTAAPSPEAFVDQHRDRLGVESICRVLRIAPSGYRRHAAQLRNPALRCCRVRRRNPSRMECQYAVLWCGEGLEAAQARRYRGCQMHGGALDASGRIAGIKRG